MLLQNVMVAISVVSANCSKAERGEEAHETMGNVELPQEAFLPVLKLDE